MSTFVSVQSRGTIALPARIRAAFHLDRPGAQVELVEEADRIILIPKLPVDASQSWFWTQAWQDGERKASREAQDGLGKVYADSEAFLDDLN